MALVIAAGLGVVVAWFLVPFALRKKSEASLAAQCRASRAIVLSYDDGPGAELTGELIALLSRESVKATFFVLGRNSVERPDLVRRLVAEGHEVGSHTHKHTNAWKTDPITAARDLAGGIRIASDLGADPRLFRPPYGKLTLAGLIDGARRGLRYGWWTVDSRDSWARRDIDDVLAEIDAKGGGVVLMHDFDNYAPPVPGAPDHAEHVLALTAKIIAFAREHGYQLMRLGDLMATHPGRPPA